VVAVAPEGTPTRERAVQPFREANAESLNSPAPRAGSIRLCDEVDVIRLDAEVKYPEARSRCGAECTADGLERPRATQRRDARPGSQGDVDGTVRVVALAPPMGDGASAGRPRAPGAGTTTAPGPDAKLELLGVRHLNRADIIPS
jgi:hypothetical protein